MRITKVAECPRLPLPGQSPKKMTSSVSEPLLIPFDWLFTIILEVSCLMLSATVVSSSYSLRVDALFDFVILFFESLNNLLIIVDNNSW